SLGHPGRWIWLLLLVPVALGLARLRFDVEIFDLLPANLDAVEGLKLYQEYFANARQLIITVRAPDSDTAERAAQSIAERLVRQTNLVAGATWEPPWVEHPEQVAELVAYLWFNQPPNVFDDLTNRLAPGKLASVLAATREQLATSLSPEDIARLSYDPFGLTRLPGNAAGAAPSMAQGQGMFSSPDGKFRIVFVEARGNLRSYRDCERWLSGIKPAVQSAVASSSEVPGQIAIGYTGRPALVAETAAGMQHDITTSVGGTAAIIAVLFWLAHRRSKPMLWLLALLALILGSTLALGGLIFGKINVVSMGFAAILLGLAVDYAVVHYQEALAHPNLSIPQIRHAIAPSIFWAAVTTITAFLVLNFGGLPGLGQLGTLVGLGVALAASIMIFEFLPPLFPNRTEQAVEPGPDPVAEPAVPARASRTRVRIVFGVTALAVGLTVAILVVLGRPPIDSTANALRPRRSPAYDSLEEIQANLNQQREPLWLIVGGRDLSQTAQRLAQVQSVLSQAVTNHLISRFTMPTPLWPRPEFQLQNRAVATQLANERERFRQAAEANGFALNSLGLTDRILSTWKRAGETTGVFWPSNQLSQWILQKIAAVAGTNHLALGLITPESGGEAQRGLSLLERELPRDQVWLSGWELLGHAIFSRVKSNMWKVVAPMIFLVLLSLWFAFRRAPEILLSLGALLLSGLCLLTVMRLAHWSWNLLSLMAIPLVLGTGVDYSIFMQLALRRYRGDLRMAYHSVGRALLLCGGTAIAAFGSLAWSSNAGMASLGQVCAVGIASNVLIAIFLAPVWWHAAIPRREFRAGHR
ncbi:MAG TPA: MMPL family transporter, partial [Verrucomicrobiae bacterium]|nr:MMPL family transporter [Verrucomicrobiae bacterium]